MVKTGRKPRAAPVTKARKDDVVRMRISAHQKQALTEAAEREGLELSVWLRQLALRAAGVLPEKFASANLTPKERSELARKGS